MDFRKRKELHTIVEDDRFGEIDQEPLAAFLSCEAFERRMDPKSHRAYAMAHQVVAAVPALLDQITMLELALEKVSAKGCSTGQIGTVRCKGFRAKDNEFMCGSCFAYCTLHPDLVAEIRQKP